MLQLLAFIRFFKEYVVFTILCIASIFLVSQSDAPQVQVFRSLAIAGLAAFQQSTTGLPSLISRSEEMESLRDVNMTLMEEVMQLRRLRHENNELRKLIGFKERSVYPLIPAEIVGKALLAGQTTLTINIGERDSVRINMPVINERGLVGKVIGVSSGYALVQLALSYDFRATVRVQRSRVDGIIAWRQGPTLLLQNIWKTADIAVGDTVVTSEVSNIFPPEIPVGTITNIGPGESGLFSKVDIEPFVDFSNLERVFVVRIAPSPERQSLEARSAQVPAE